MKSNTITDLDAQGSGNAEVERSKVFNLAGMQDYIANSIIIKTVIRKPNGHVCVFAFDAGEEMAGKYSPFDNLLQVVEGEAEIIIDDESFFLRNGEAIIIPAHSRSILKATVRFKLLSFLIKSGNENIG